MYFKNIFFYFFISDNTAFSSSNPHAFQINFNSLYTALCEQQKSDQATLLLYMLLHQNSNVRTYVLARTDIENLVSLALPPLFSSQEMGPASLGVSSCQWPLFCSGSTRFWIMHSPVLAHLLVFVMSVSQECSANMSLQSRVVLVKLQDYLGFPLYLCHYHYPGQNPPLLIVM